MTLWRVPRSQALQVGARRHMSAFGLFISLIGVMTASKQESKHASSPSLFDFTSCRAISKRDRH